MGYLDETELTDFVEPDPSTGRTDRFSFVQASKTPLEDDVTLLVMKSPVRKSR